MMAKDHIRKIDKSGEEICVACDGGLITYSEGGLGTIKAHLETLKHFKCIAALAKNQLLPGSTTDVSEICMMHHQHITMAKMLCQRL